MTVKIETANRDHLDQMVDILNDIIQVGHFTAHRRRFDADRMLGHYLEPAGLISCVVAVDGEQVLGFQSLEWDHSDTNKTVASIATFARLGCHRKGVARALLAQTQVHAHAAGVKEIDATIRADNINGLGFYRSIGFKDVHIYRDAPMSDGVKVDRIQTRYDLTHSVFHLCKNTHSTDLSV